jgi:hypothetical protein
MFRQREALIFEPFNIIGDTMNEILVAIIGFILLAATLCGVIYFMNYTTQNLTNKCSEYSCDKLVRCFKGNDYCNSCNSLIGVSLIDMMKLKGCKI